MLTTAETKTLKNLLDLAPVPEQTFTYDELLGFLFGLAMTPDIVLPSEWMPIIFAGDSPNYNSREQAQTMTNCLLQVYNRFIADFHDQKLNFPYDIENLEEQQLDTLYDWVSGFEEAIILREELWDPEEYPELPDRKKEELYHSMMTIQGLVDPMEVMDFFDSLPDKLFQDTFADMDNVSEDREVQIQVFLMASLPMAVDTFQEHARTLEKKRQQQFPGHGAGEPIQAVKVGRNEPCPCNSGKKYKKCCGSGGTPQSDPFTGGSTKKSNVIKVDFPRHGKKRDAIAPIYQLKVELQGAKPPIWRRIQVPGHTTLSRLHDILQICMGWDNQHLHQFLINRTCYCLPEEDDSFRTSRPKNEAKYTLQDLEGEISPRFQYIYDYGDDWLHQIIFEKTLPPQEGESSPVLVTGRRACPPEDCGGIHGYMRLLEILANPEDEEYQEIIDWLGMDFEPARFGKEDIAVINVVMEELFTQGK
jgi:yecA family protein